MIQSITTKGKEGPTLAEAKRSVTVLHTLQRKIPLFQNAWIKKLWVSSSTSENPAADSNEPAGAADPQSILTESAVTQQSITTPSKITPLQSPSVSFSRPLNDSQLLAVEQMLAHDGGTDVSVIQGPPGTGKTTVIAAFASSILAGSKRTLWLTAKSNVAVKNIAEKLADCGILNWKLVVSRDFHLGW